MLPWRWLIVSQRTLILTPFYRSDWCLLGFSNYNFSRGVIHELAHLIGVCPGGVVSRPTSLEGMALCLGAPPARCPIARRRSPRAGSTAALGKRNSSTCILGARQRRKRSAQSARAYLAERSRPPVLPQICHWNFGVRAELELTI
jgi:hypothetical protein